MYHRFVRSSPHGENVRLYGITRVEGGGACFGAEPSYLFFVRFHYRAPSGAEPHVARYTLITSFYCCFPHA